MLSALQASSGSTPVSVSFHVLQKEGTGQQKAAETGRIMAEKPPSGSQKNRLFCGLAHVSALKMRLQQGLQACRMHL